MASELRDIDAGLQALVISPANFAWWMFSERLKTVGIDCAEWHALSTVAQHLVLHGLADIRKEEDDV